MRQFLGRAGLQERHLLLALLVTFIGVVIFRMTQLVLIVDLELLGGLRVLVDLKYGCLIVIGMFIVSVIVVILRAGRGVLGGGAFNSVSASLQQFAGAVSAAVAGWLIVQKPNG